MPNSVGTDSFHKFSVLPPPLRVGQHAVRGRSMNCAVVIFALIGSMNVYNDMTVIIYPHVFTNLRDTHGTCPLKGFDGTLRVVNGFYAILSVHFVVITIWNLYNS